MLRDESKSGRVFPKREYLETKSDNSTTIFEKEKERNEKRKKKKGTLPEKIYLYQEEFYPNEEKFRDENRVLQR